MIQYGMEQRNQQALNCPTTTRAKDPDSNREGGGEDTLNMDDENRKLLTVLEHRNKEARRSPKLTSTIVP